MYRRLVHVRCYERNRVPKISSVTKGMTKMQKDERPGPKSMRAEIELPMPPSVNQLWFNVPGKGRARTEPYRNWIEAAGWELKSQRPENIVGSVAVKISAGAGDKVRDLDNLIKPLLDLLVTHAVIADDADVASIVAGWDRNGMSGRVKVEGWRTVPPRSPFRRPWGYPKSTPWSSCLQRTPEVGNRRMPMK